MEIFCSTLGQTMYLFFLILIGFVLAKTKLLPILPESFFVCLMASLAMPLGLNTVVVPSAYGKDVSVAAGMALVSHLLSCITIPLIFLFM